MRLREVLSEAQEIILKIITDYIQSLNSQEKELRYRWEGIVESFSQVNEYPNLRIRIRRLYFLAFFLQDLGRNILGCIENFFQCNNFRVDVFLQDGCFVQSGVHKSIESCHREKKELLRKCGVKDLLIKEEYNKDRHYQNSIVEGDVKNPVTLTEMLRDCEHLIHQIFGITNWSCK